MDKQQSKDLQGAASVLVCQAPEYLQCAMQAADEGVKPVDIKEYCGCSSSK